MNTKIIKATGAADPIIAQAGNLLRNGRLVAFPTETVYGLGANGLDPAACQKIFEVKGRPPDKPLTLHVSSRKMINFIAEVNPIAERLIEKFFPGPLTLILPKRPSVPDAISRGLPTVGVRMPANEIALAMISAAGMPIAAPSANISDRPAPTTAQAVLSDLGGKIPLILDGGTCRLGRASTIVDVSTEDWKVIRPGVITRAMLAAVIKN